MTEYRSTTLPNGIRIVSVPMPHLHSVETAIYFGAGGRDEEPARAGLSHFLEHMLFRGCAGFPTSMEIERAFEDIGGAVNASTDAESTCYHSRVHPDYLERAIELYRPLLREPLYGDMETERSIILEEALEDYNEQGEEISPDNLTSRLLWPVHPLGQPTIGTPESIAATTVDDLKAYHARFYRPDNMVVAAAGRVDHDQLVAVVAKEFGDWTAPDTPLPHRTDGIAVGGKASSWVRDTTAQVSLQLAYPVCGRREGNLMPLRLLRRVLAWGGSSLLMAELREREGLVYNVDAGVSQFDESGCFSIDLSLNPANALNALERIGRIFRELCEKPVDAAELEAIKRSYRFDLDYSYDMPEAMVYRFGFGLLSGSLRTLEQDREELDRVTPEELMELARELFAKPQVKLAAVGPVTPEIRTAVEKLIASW